MKNCPKCSAKTYEEDLFCGSCGFNLINYRKGTSVTQQELRVSDVRFNLGIVYMKKSEFAKAIEIFSKILVDEPNNKKVIEMLQEATSKEKQMAQSSIKHS